VPAFFLALAPSEAGPEVRGAPAGFACRRRGQRLTIIAAYSVRGPLTPAQGAARCCHRRAWHRIGWSAGRRAAVRPGVGVAAFAAVLVVGMRVPWLRDFFAAVEPTGAVWAAVGACLAVGIAGLVVVRRIPWLARIEGGSP
jgi:hypothetical protein